MKTISLRELHNNTGKWVRAAKDEEEIRITDRGVEVAVLTPTKKPGRQKYTWANRPFRPGFAALMKAGKLRSNTDSSLGISEDRTSRDNSVAGAKE